MALNISKEKYPDNDWVLDPSLVLYLPLHRLDGASIASRDKHGHLFTVTGALWTPWGRSFDPVDDVITAVSDATGNVGAGDFSIIFWIKRTGNWTDGVYRSVLWKKLTHMEAAGGGYSFTVYSNSLLFQARGANDGGLSSFSGFSTPLNVWVCIGVSVSRAGTTMTQVPYTNGIASTSVNNTINGTLDNNEPLKIYNGYQHPDGTAEIGEVLMYLRALAPLEFQQKFLATKWRYV